ncbi:hypothetical protein SAMN05216302_105011 [Nitrosomonas aestuarii]|uniref:Uncharacterized protein n=1 Tax=Nitrosomonas aestuarii TaxID=52441 RepID=A0A1I4GB15_9PROT|nr:hypothetical protein [Nitrosomonas aestuarii]SFL26733.1 hypothetical protein SAMN05216302_105011 [Nitrosomonas aestuarii]
MRHTISFTLAIMLSALGVSVPTWAGELVRAKGDFTVEIDFSTLALRPVDENCLLTIEGVVNFTGTLEGIALARTRALALASCEEVSTSPPGAYEDVFTSAFEFAGKVDGRPVVADFTYRGRTAIGGEIDAVFAPSNGFRGRLFVNAIVAVGGSYNGYLRVVNH